MKLLTRIKFHLTRLYTLPYKKKKLHKHVCSLKDYHKISGGGIAHMFLQTAFLQMQLFSLLE